MTPPIRNNNNTNNTNNVQRFTQIRRITLNFNILPKGNYSLSESTMSTLAVIMALGRTRGVRAGRSFRTIHDNTSPGYAWLLPGWLCEERQLPQGGVYRFYFDPNGGLYRSREEVITHWEMCGLVVILDD